MISKILRDDRITNLQKDSHEEIDTTKAEEAASRIHGTGKLN